MLDIEQDSHGFLWFATQDGLNRYDGNVFVVYKHDHQDADSLSDNFVQSVQEDRSGALWVGTHNRGLDRFDALLTPLRQLSRPYEVSSIRKLALKTW